MSNMYKLELVLNTNLNSTDDMLHIYIYIYMTCIVHICNYFV